MAGGSTRPRGKNERHHAQDECQRGHQNRAQTQMGGFNGGVKDAQAFLHLQCGKFHDQNGVLGRQADQHQQTDLEVDVVGRAPEPKRNEGAQYGVGNRQHHGNRKRPALVKSSQNQEDDDQTEKDSRRRGSSDSFLVPRLTGPFNAVAFGENFFGNFFHDADGFARTDAFNRRSHELCSQIAVHAAKRIGAGDAAYF